MAFNRFAWSGQAQPMAPKPEPADRHGAQDGPTSAWTVPSAGTGQGYADPQPVVPGMQARGLQRDIGYAYGHEGTEVTRAAQAPSIGRYVTPEHARDTLQARAAAAHGDIRTTNLYTHQYNAIPQDTAGESQGVDAAAGLAGPTMTAQAALHDRPGGQFSSGADGQFGPKGFRIGMVRRWAHRQYSTPLLGAMYSKNSLRGILPQTVATPYNQPALAGVRESGISSNGRFLPVPFTLPQMFTVPRSESDVLMALQGPGVSYTPVIDTGMM